MTRQPCPAELPLCWCGIRGCDRPHSDRRGFAERRYRRWVPWRR